MNNEITQLEKKVALLEKWKSDRQSERLRLPLDNDSRITLKSYKTVNTPGLIECRNNIFASTYIDALSELLDYGIEVNINGKKRVLFVTYPRKQVTVNTSSDVVTSVDGSHNLKNGDLVTFTTTGTLPTGITDFTSYYIVQRTGSTFKISLTDGGSAVDITSTGSGTLYYSKI